MFETLLRAARSYDVAHFPRNVGFVQVEMKCSEGDAVSITAVEEPTVCSYLMSISCPLACGGAWKAIPTTSDAPPASLSATVTAVPESPAQPASASVEVLPTAVGGIQQAG